LWLLQAYDKGEIQELEVHATYGVKNKGILENQEKSWLKETCCSENQSNAVA